MKLLIVRDLFKADSDAGHGWTLSKCYVDGKLFGFVCEDMDRGLDSTMELEEIQALKVKSRTAIPVGVYKVKLYNSPKHGPDTLELVDVLGFQHIQVHVGNDETDTEGCLLVGLSRNVRDGTVIKSRLALNWIAKNVRPHARAGDLTIEVTRDAAAWDAFQKAPA